MFLPCPRTIARSLLSGFPEVSYREFPPVDGNQSFRVFPQFDDFALAAQRMLGRSLNMAHALWQVLAHVFACTFIPQLSRN
jgi:hypothetical protein